MGGRERAMPRMDVHCACVCARVNVRRYMHRHKHTHTCMLPCTYIPGNTHIHSKLKSVWLCSLLLSRAGARSLSLFFLSLSLRQRQCLAQEYSC